MKKLTALFLAALLAFSCFGCTPAPEPGESKNEAPADPKVIDGETYTHDVFGETGTYTLPRIEYAKNGVEAVNSQIRETLYKDYLSKVKIYADDGWAPALSSMTYRWGFKGRYLTVAEISRTTASAKTTVTPFCVDLETMTLTDDPFALLAEFGLTKDAFLAQAQKDIANTLYDEIEEFLYGTEYSMAVEAERAFRVTCGKENVARSTPFILGQELAIRCTLSSLAGADNVERIIAFGQKMSPDAETYLADFDFNMPTDYTSLVTDGEIYTVNNPEWDYSARFIIPRISSPHGREDQMNATLTAEVLKILDTSINAVDGPGPYDSWEYTWGFAGHYISVIMSGHAFSTSFTEYKVMNFDVFSGELVSDAELLAYFGLYDQAEYRAQVKGLAGSEFLGSIKDLSEQALTDFADSIDYAFEYTIADNHIDHARPVIGEGSELYVLAQIGQIAGPSYQWKLLRYDDEISDAFYQKAAKG